MDNATRAKEIGMATGLPEIAPSTCPRPLPERKARPQKDQALNCPRCHSTNTKFCYYNNYSLTQPRYFCKTCRRYWTEGGSLRNVPVGGGSRKNKRSTTSSSNSSNKLLDLNPPGLPQFSSQNPIKILEGRDLNLAFPANKQHFRGAAQFLELAKIDNNSSNQLSSSVSSTSSASTSLSALELLRTGSSSRGLNSFVPPPMLPDANMMYTSGLSFQNLKPNFEFSADGLSANRYWRGLYHAVQENSGRVMFPFGAVNKQISSTNEVDEDKVHVNPTGYWNGMLGGGSW